jgi:hypothetical protein
MVSLVAAFNDQGTFRILASSIASRSLSLTGLKICHVRIFSAHRSHLPSLIPLRQRWPLLATPVLCDLTAMKCLQRAQFLWGLQTSRPFLPLRYLRIGASRNCHTKYPSGGSNAHTRAATASSGAERPSSDIWHATQMKDRTHAGCQNAIVASNARTIWRLIILHMPKWAVAIAMWQHWTKRALRTVLSFAVDWHWTAGQLLNNCEDSNNRSRRWLFRPTRPLLHFMACVWGPGRLKVWNISPRMWDEYASAVR